MGFTTIPYYSLKSSTTIKPNDNKSYKIKPSIIEQRLIPTDMSNCSNLTLPAAQELENLYNQNY